MKCHLVSPKQGLLYRLHLLYCAECRNHRPQERQLVAGIQQLKRVEIPHEGLAKTLQAVQAVERTTQASMPFSHDLVRRKPRFWKPVTWKRLGKIAVGGGLTFWMIALYMEAIPNIQVPSPSLPRFNAFDIYLRAADSVHRTTERFKREAQAAERSNSKNTMRQEKRTYDVQKGDLANIVSTDPVSDAITTPEEAKRLGKPLYNTAQKEKILTAYSEGLAIFRTGLNLPYQNPPIRSYSTLLPYYADFRAMARVLRLEAQVHEERGEWAKAMDTRLDSFRFATQIPHGSTLIGELVGAAIQEIGRQGANTTVEHLSASEANKALTRLNEITKDVLPFSGTLQEEMWASQSGLLEMFTKNKWNWRPQLISMTYGGGSDQQSSSWARTLPLFLYSKRRIIANMTHYYEAEIERCSKPYSDHLPITETPSDAVSQLLLPYLANAYFQWTYTQLRLEILKAQLALQAYRQDHGSYPKQLSELVSQHYLQQYPKDLFASDQQFHYALVKADKYLLYSVGPDGTDQHGAPATNPSMVERGKEKVSDSYRYQVQEASKGDIVVGIHVR